MRIFYKSLVFLLFTFISSCSGEDCFDIGDGRRVKVERNADSTGIVRIYHQGEITDTMRIPYPIFNADYGDVNGDGEAELLLGVVKSTRFWQDKDRRLFIYKIYEKRYIRPLWLGSRLTYKLEGFYADRSGDTAVIITKETDTAGNTHTFRYIQKGFGVKYKR